MENLCSSNQYDRDAVIRKLWKSERAIPVLPINPNLDALRVLNKQSDGSYHDVGTVYSLCKTGEDKEWLKDVVYSERRFPPESIGEQTFVISDDNGELAKALVGPANAAAWFKESESIQIRIAGCKVREFNMEKWDEMIQHFKPDLLSPTLGPPGRDGKHGLFIVQKVVLVSHIQITACYKCDAGPEVSGPEMPSQGVNVKANVRTTSSSIVAEFTLSASQENQKLPVAFSGFVYTYDKFGNRDLYGKETRLQSDAVGGEIGESSGASQDDDSEEEDEEDDDPQTDEHMGTFLVDNEWFATIMPSPSPEIEIPPHLAEVEEEEERLDAGEEEEVEEEENDAVHKNAPVPGLDDID